VLHGRAAFDGQRRMCGAYVAADEFRSKLAVLRERFSGGLLYSVHKLLSMYTSL
jgi:hypothetical protein